MSLKPSKTNKTIFLIIQYMKNQIDVIKFVNQCKTYQMDFLQTDVNSHEFNNSIQTTFDVCNDIGISQLFPNVLYDQVNLAYTVYNKHNDILNTLNGIKFVDNTIAG